MKEVSTQLNSTKIYSSSGLQNSRRLAPALAADGRRVSCHIKLEKIKATDLSNEKLRDNIHSNH
jgi:hypothetical protein